MATVSFSIDEGQEQRLNELSAAARRSTEELCREALEQYLRRHEHPAPGETPDGYAALRTMIGLVKGGPADASVRHDVRPGDEP
jgi:hypothetical protein